MRHYSVIGCPIAHSLSPRLYAGLFAELGVEADFTKTLVLPQELPDIRSITHGLDGFAVTMPHKRAIIPYLDSLDASALRCGSVNIVKRERGKLIGYNTDGAGLLASMHGMGFEPSGSSVAILGRGGAAIAAASALAEAGASVTLLVRSFKPNDDPRFAHALFKDYSEPCTAFINATPLGMEAGESFADFEFLKCLSPRFVYDMVYLKDGETQLVQAARALGCSAQSGHEMLKRQALLALSIWLGASENVFNS